MLHFHASGLLPEHLLTPSSHLSSFDKTDLVMGLPCLPDLEHLLSSRIECTLLGVADWASLGRSFAATSNKSPLPLTLSSLFSCFALLRDITITWHYIFLLYCLSSSLECHHMKAGVFVCLLLCQWYLPPKFCRDAVKMRAKGKGHWIWSDVKLPMTFTRWFWAKKPDHVGGSRDVEEAVGRISRFFFSLGEYVSILILLHFLAAQLPTLLSLEQSPPLTWCSLYISGHSFSVSFLWFSVLFSLLRTCLLVLPMVNGFPLFRSQLTCLLRTPSSITVSLFDALTSFDLAGPWWDSPFQG